MLLASRGRTPGRLPEPLVVPVRETKMARRWTGHLVMWFEAAATQPAGLRPPVVTKLTQSPWFLNCGKFFQPPCLH